MVKFASVKFAPETFEQPLRPELASKVASVKFASMMFCAGEGRAGDDAGGILAGVKESSESACGGDATDGGIAIGGEDFYDGVGIALPAAITLLGERWRVPVSHPADRRAVSEWDDVAPTFEVLESMSNGQ